jgi:glycosyltransferase involved in cell wall biosynthesis
LADVKGVPLLLEAFSRLRANHPKAALTIVGDGELRDELQANARAKNLTDVRFTGAIGQSEVAEELARSAIFVLPSYAEGVPVVLMEAMAAGRPVVTSHITGIPELVEDGASGFLTEPGDIDALTQAIETLLSDPDMGAALGQVGRAKVNADFDIDSEAKRLHALFTAYDAGTSPDQVRL